MTDGPFRNAQLSGRWKRYGRDLVSDAASQDERTARACHSMLGDVDLKALGSLLRELKAHAQRPQMDLDPVASTDIIFGNHPKSPLADALQKHLTAQLRSQRPFEAGLEQALNDATTEWIGITKNRLDEECIRARDIGDMTRDEYRKGIDRNLETFRAIDPTAIREALALDNARAFKKAVTKKDGLDEGPD